MARLVPAQRLARADAAGASVRARHGVGGGAPPAARAAGSREDPPAWPLPRARAGRVLVRAAPVPSSEEWGGVIGPAPHGPPPEAATDAAAEVTARGAPARSGRSVDAEPGDAEVVPTVARDAGDFGRGDGRVATAREAEPESPVGASAPARAPDPGAVAALRAEDGADETPGAVRATPHTAPASVPSASVPSAVVRSVDAASTPAPGVSAPSLVAGAAAGALTVSDPRQPESDGVTGVDPRPEGIPQFTQGAPHDGPTASAAGLVGSAAAEPAEPPAAAAPGAPPAVPEASVSSLDGPTNGTAPHERTPHERTPLQWLAALREAAAPARPSDGRPTNAAGPRGAAHAGAAPARAATTTPGVAPQGARQEARVGMRGEAPRRKHQDDGPPAPRAADQAAEKPEPARQVPRAAAEGPGRQDDAPSGTPTAPDDVAVPAVAPPPADVGARVVTERLESSAHADHPAHPVAPSTRRFLRPLLGVDPATVRVHRGPAADAFAAAHGADALALASDADGGAPDDVVLGDARAERSPDGLALLAHELTHVARRRTPGYLPPVARDRDGAGADAVDGGADDEAVARSVEHRVRHLARGAADAGAIAAAPPAGRAAAFGADEYDVAPPASAFAADVVAAPVPAPAIGTAAVGTAAVEAPAGEAPAVGPAGRSWGGLPAPWEPLPLALLGAAGPRATGPRAAGPPAGAEAPAGPPAVQRAAADRPVPAAADAPAAAAPRAAARAPAGGGGAPGPDVDALARQVFEAVKRRLAAERRRGA